MGYEESLLAALNSVERTGSFAVTGTLESYTPPGLFVPELGLISLPLIPQQAEALAKLCSQAPFGRREATVYDESVRKCLQLSPDQFQLSAPEWTSQVERLAGGAIRRDLGLPEHVKVVPQLYKLLLYKPGDHFTPHRDTEKADGMFATLVVLLPSAHSGGELLVRHAGKESIFDSGTKSLHHLHYAAFFADCEHEIRTLQSGYRLALIYNLVAQGSSKVIAPVDNRPAVRQVLDAMEAWCQDSNGLKKLVMPLEHQYCTKSLSFDSLKGADIAKVETILEAHKAAIGTPRFHVRLGMLTKEESGYGNGYGNGYGSYCGHDLEVEESSFMITDIVGGLGEELKNADLDVKEEELLPEDALENRDWDEENINEATGNSGATMERWYHQAAVILWPNLNEWEKACDQDLGQAVKDMLTLAETVREAQPDSKEREDLDVALWTIICRAPPELSTEQTHAIAGCIIGLDDFPKAELLLENLPASLAAEAVVPLGNHFGWTNLEAAVTSLCEQTCTPFSLKTCFNLLLKVAPSTTTESLTTESVAQPSRSTDCEGNPSNHSASAEAGTDADREILCTNIIPLLVAKICKEQPEQPASLFSLDDVATASAFVRVLERFGLDVWKDAAASLVKQQIRSSFSSVPDLLLQLVKKQRSLAGQAAMSSEAKGLCCTLADVLVRQILTEPEPSQPARPLPYAYPGQGQSPFRTPSFVTSTLTALHLLSIDAAVIASVVGRFLSASGLYDLKATLLPALKQLAAWLSKSRLRHPWLVQLWQGCVNALEGATRTKPAEPRNWHVPATVRCPCNNCQQLVQFCVDPKRTVLQLRATKAEKTHMQAHIRSNNLPVRIDSESYRGGVNVPLACFKNGSTGKADEEAFKQSSAKKAQYEKDMKVLAEIRALGGTVLQKRSTNQPVTEGRQEVQVGEQHIDKKAKIVIDLGD